MKWTILNIGDNNEMNCVIRKEKDLKNSGAFFFNDEMKVHLNRPK